MAKCPSCRNTLSDNSLHVKKCDECGFSLDEDGSVDQTIDSGDSSDFDDLAEELGRLASAGTVDSTTLPDGVSIPAGDDADQVPDKGDSGDDFTLTEMDEAGEPSHSQTIDSSNLSDDFVMPGSGDSEPVAPGRAERRPRPLRGGSGHGRPRPERRRGRFPPARSADSTPP